MNETSLLRKAPGETAGQASAAAKTNAISDVRTLRDEFAMASLDHAASIYAKMSMAELDRMLGRKNHTKDEAVARLAYKMADAMLAAREV